MLVLSASLLPEFYQLDELLDLKTCWIGKEFTLAAADDSVSMRVNDKKAGQFLLFFKEIDRWLSFSIFGTDTLKEKFLLYVGVFRKNGFAAMVFSRVWLSEIQK